MSLSYSTYVTALSTLTNIASTDTAFQAILPDCIDYSEQRIYRELNLLSTVVRDASQALAPGSRNFTLPTAQGTFVVVNRINAVTPAGTQPSSGTRNALLPVSLDYLDNVWPSSDATYTGLPTAFAMVTQTSIVVGPWPDQAYTMEVVGTQRPLPLSASNTVTFLSDSLPDLFLAASMVFMAGYMRNFGSQADDPKMAASWEQQVQTLKASAETEEARKRFMGSAWSSLTQSSQATPARN
jgi:hypothetical protein